MEDIGMVNQSKKNDPRFWKKWEESGAIGTMPPQKKAISVEKAKVQVLFMDEAKEKLRELNKYLPMEQDLTYEFGRLLSEYLNPQLVPEGFVLGCYLLINDLQKGVDGFTQDPIRSSLVGMPPIVYNMLIWDISRIAEVIFPEEFASEVKSFIRETDQKKAEKK